MKGDAAADLVGGTRMHTRSNGRANTSTRPMVNALAIMTIAALVSGCAVAMLGGAARSGGSSAPASSSRPSAGTQAKPASTLAADNAISTAVRSRFAARPALKPLKVSVDTQDGVVTLRGHVNNVEQRSAAQLEARAVSGVKAVKNELTVR